MMTLKRMVSVLLCISIFFSGLPTRAFAENVAGASVKEGLEQTNSFGELGGYLSGNTLTASKLFEERKFTWAGGGHGFAAERGNNLIDRLKGLDAHIVGDNNVANGPDRKIINRGVNAGKEILIQDKYYANATSSVNAAFDEVTGLYRYIDADGRPMQLEVPKDQYQDALEQMRSKIEKGLVPGVTDPDKASEIVDKGHLSYQQAVNIAKAGKVESLVYDAVKGVVVAGCATGIGFALDYACYIFNGADQKTALKNAGLNGLKSGGTVFAVYVISSQLAKTGAANAFVPTAGAIAKSLGEDVCEAIVKRVGTQVAGTSSAKAIAEIISKELLADGVLIVVLTAKDVMELFRGRISKEELLKNLTVTVVSIAAGTAGGYGGAAVGTLVAPGIGTTVGSVVGGVLGGGLSGWAAEKVISHFYESDAEEMFNIISNEFTGLCEEYLIDKDEGSQITNTLKTTLSGDVLKNMYASEDRNQFARELLEPLFIDEVEQRPEIVVPTEEELRYEMKSSLRGIVFIH